MAHSLEHFAGQRSDWEMLCCVLGTMSYLTGKTCSCKNYLWNFVPSFVVLSIVLCLQTWTVFLWWFIKILTVLRLVRGACLLDEVLSMFTTLRSYSYCRLYRCIWRQNTCNVNMNHKMMVCRQISSCLLWSDRSVREPWQKVDMIVNDIFYIFEYELPPF